jgi:hypothetical protein
MDYFARRMDDFERLLDAAAERGAHSIYEGERPGGPPNKRRRM